MVRKIAKMKLKNEVLYYIFFSCFIVYWGFDVTLINSGINYNVLKDLVFIIGFGTFVIHWFKSKFSIIEIIKQCIFLAVILFVYIVSGMTSSGLLIIFPAIVGLKNIEIKKVVKVMFWTLTITFSLFIILCLVNVIPSSTYTKTDAFGNTYNMIMFGNQHGNTIYVIWFNILCSYIYAYYEKIKKKDFIILLVISILFFMILSSRTGLLLSIITIILTYSIKYIKVKSFDIVNKILRILIKYSYVIFYIAVFLIAAFLSETQLYDFLNDLISSRISEVRYYLIDIGFGLLPQKVIYYWICDNMQIKILVSYGLIFTFLYLMYSVKTIDYLLKKNMNIEILMMIMYLLYSYSEVAFFKPISDFTMLFFTYVLFNNYYQTDNKEEIKDGESTMYKIKNSIKIGNLFEKIFCYILIFLGFSNERIQVMEVRCKKYNFLKRKYFEKIDLKKYKNEKFESSNDNIWFCWLQGKDKMPTIVQKCYEQLIFLHSDKNIIFLDANNYEEYIKLPSYIIEKWKDGIISHAHFSDVIRTALLAEHGGLWIDATTYLTSKIPNYIFESKMFMFDMSNEDDIMIYNNWFIYTKKNNRIFLALRDYLYLFWKKENKVHEYFVWHLFMRHIYNFYEKDFECITYIPHECSHMLIKKINDKYDEQYFKLADKICPIQKLTYKNIDEKKENTFYQYIISKDVK